MSLDLLPTGCSPELAGLPGYPAPVISGIIRGYLERGARVTAVTTSTNLKETVTVTSGPLTIMVVPRTRPRSALQAFRAERQSIMWALQQDPPDVLHAHWTYEFAAAAQDTRLPSLITAHDDARIVLRFQPTLYRLLRLALSDKVLKRASHVSTPSAYLASKIYPRTQGSVSVIPNFLGGEVSLRDLAPAQRGKTIITVSNGFTGRKNVAAAVRAFAASHAGEQGWEYELVGEGMEPGGEAERWAQEECLDRGVRFRGSINYQQTLDAIERAAVMIHPSLEESFGMTVLEAMALGTPVIGGVESGNVPALLCDGCGVLCDVSEPRSITRALDDLIAQPVERLLIARQARTRALSEYCQDGVIGQYMDSLSAIVAASAAKESDA